MKILFVTARFPYPPIKGDKIISYQRLKYFSHKHEISLLSFANRKVEPDHISAIQQYCKQIHIIPLCKAESLLNILLKGLSDVPLQILFYKSRCFKAKLEKLLRKHKYDLIHGFMLRIASYISDYNDCPKIIELIDSMELNMRRRASLEKTLKKWIFNKEAGRLSLYEKIIVKNFNYAMVVSEIDRKIIGQDNIVVNPLGIDTENFHSTKHKKKDPYLVIFTGNMGYFPNEHAVLYFVNNIFPLIQKRIPEVNFWVAGRGVSSTIKRLEKKNKAIKILGFVESIVDCINEASVSVCPMMAGSGMQFKILEALACGVPVVATSLAKGSIDLNEEHGLFVEDNEKMFAETVIKVLKNKSLQTVISKAGPAAITDKYSWERSNLIVENIYSKLVSKKDGYKCEKL